MKWMKFTIETTTQATELISYFLTEMGIEGVEIEDNVPLTQEESDQMYIDIPAVLPEDDGTAKVHFYVVPDSELVPFYSTGSSIRDSKAKEEKNYLFSSVEELMERIKVELQELSAFTDIGQGKIDWEYTEDKDWMNNWKEFFKPFYVAEDILIKPTWEEIPTECGPETTIIQIDPGTAFGTGSHETTRLCLMSLRKYLKPQMKILDAGCGSGILAIAALKLGAGYSFGVDIDPAAVTASVENCVLNGIDTASFDAVCGNILTGENTEKIKAQGGFDIVVANILADVIVQLSGKIREYMKPEGLFVSSGILAEKADEVEQALLANDFEIVEKNVLGEWVSFVAR